MLRKPAACFSYTTYTDKKQFTPAVYFFEEYSMVNFALTEKLGKKNSEFQMGFEPTTLRDLVGCSTTELLETLW